MEAEKPFDAERAKILLNAMCDILDDHTHTIYVQSFFKSTATWDDAECDGYCLYEEAKELLGRGDN